MPSEIIAQPKNAQMPNVQIPPVKIGIIGEMGKQAGITFYQALCAAFAKAGLDKANILLMGDEDTPDRTEAILNNGASPVPNIAAIANQLKAQGANYGVMACNTAHYFLPEICKATNLEMLDMIDITANYINTNYSNSKPALLVTDGTRKTGIYAKYLGNFTTPPEDMQKNVHAAIYGADYGKNGIKNGPKFYQENADLLSEVIIDLIEREGANIFILGCTELPLILTQVRQNLASKLPNLNIDKADGKDGGIIFIDPMEIMIEHITELALASQENTA